ncbi:MAG: MFS transporter [Parcubacteria group bacterium]|nr:MFS transporter [Parcubacteria group bacterium]
MRILFFNRALRILLWTNAMILLAGAMLGPIYALFVEKIGGDLLDASFAGALFALAAGFASLVSGKYADAIRENELIIAAGYVVMSIGFFSYLFVDSVAQLFLVQVIIGLGGAVYAPAFDAVYSKHLDGRRSGAQWGAWESMAYFTTAFGAAAGGLCRAGCCEALLKRKWSRG